MKEVNARLCVVEDNPTDVILLKHALHRHGVLAILDVIEDGESALRRVSELGAGGEELPDLLIVDINLPRHDGTEVLARIAANESLAQLPVIVMTSSTSPAEHEVVRRFGAKLIRKPIDLDGFMAIGSELRHLLAIARDS
jgi:CheY-like chemotaxis protein